MTFFLFEYHAVLAIFNCITFAVLSIFFKEHANSNIRFLGECFGDKMILNRRDLGLGFKKEDRRCDLFFINIQNMWQSIILVSDFKKTRY